MSVLRAYTDGSCLSNPGPGGVGCVFLDVDDVVLGKFKQGYQHTTNNRMELLAAYYAVREAYTQGKDVLVISDSRYVVDGANDYILRWRKNNYKGGTVKNQDLWRILDVYLQAMKYKFMWVKAHNGNKYNEIADQLAFTAANAPTLRDLGYEEICNE